MTGAQPAPAASPASQPQPAPRGATALLAISLLATVAVAGFAMIGSFRAMADYAETLGLATNGWSWTFPAVIDGTVIVSSFVTIARGLRRAGGWHSTAVNLLAVAVSVVVNVAHAPDGNPEAQALAAVFPLFLAACAHLVFAEVRDLLHRDPTTATPAAAGPSTAGRLAQLAARRLERALDVPAGEAAPAKPAAAGARADTPADIRPDIVPDRRVDTEGPADTGQPTPPPMSAPADIADRRSAEAVTAADSTPDTVAELVRAHLAAGGELSDAALTAAVATTLDVTDRTARRRLQPYRDPDPAPLALVAGNGGPSR